MKTVRFEANERVDIPDMTALANLPLGEFRRQVRALLAGSDVARVVNGFAVEQQTVASAIVEVHLNNGPGNWPSHAVVSDDTATGQLAGGFDDQGLPEGSATLSLDFTGQPPDTYAVEMRYVMVPGDPQNRAFINPTTKVEHTEEAETRLVPQLELGFALAPSGGEWLHLADVVWGGTTITNSDITDQRLFALEGGPAGLFQATEWGGAGGQPDFERGTFRENIEDANAIWVFARLLARQIQDIKGFSGSGKLDSFSRVVGPPRAGAGGLPEEQTRSLSSLDVDSFTVGDGGTTFGDFNGVNGLQDALDHIVSQKAFLANTVVIVLKTRSANATATLFNLVTPVDLTGLCVKIIASNGNSTTRGRVIVDFQHTSGAFFITSGANNSLELVGIQSTTPSVSNIVYPIAETGLAPLIVENCSFAVSRSLGLPVLTGGRGSRIVGSTISGDIQVLDRSVVQNIIGNAAVGAYPAPTRVVILPGASYVQVSECSPLLGVVGFGASFVSIERCEIQHDHLDGIALGPTSSLDCAHWRIAGVRFTGNTSPTGHVTTNGSVGTGWGIHCYRSDGGTLRATDITVDGITTTMARVDAGFMRCAQTSGVIIRHATVVQTDPTTTDARQVGFWLEQCSRVLIEDCTWDGLSTGNFHDDVIWNNIRIVNDADNITIQRCVFDMPDTIATGFTRNIHCVTQAGTQALRQLKIRDNEFRRLNNNANSTHIGFGVYDSANAIHIKNNAFVGAGAAIAPSVHFSTSVAPADLQIVGNSMLADARGIELDGGGTRVSIHHNRFVTTVKRFFFDAATSPDNSIVDLDISDNAIAGVGDDTEPLVNTPNIVLGLTLRNNRFSTGASNTLARIGTPVRLIVLLNSCTTGSSLIKASALPSGDIGWADATFSQHAWAILP